MNEVLLNTEMVAMSFDMAASPSIELTAVSASGERPKGPCGWGFAWYPPRGQAAALIKDPTSIGENAMTQVLRNWNRFRSQLFLCHIQGAAKRITQQDTHPFCRSFAGKDWLLAHNGDLAGDLSVSLPLGNPPMFEPMGKTDSEHLLCWLLTKIRECPARSLEDVGWDRLMSWFAQANELGTLNLGITDGVDLAIYQDRADFNPLHWIRRVPPHRITRLADERIALDFSDPYDRTCTMLLFSTRPLSGEEWTPMKPGQLLVARQGVIVYDSLASPNRPTLRRRVVPIDPIGALPSVVSEASPLEAVPPEAPKIETRDPEGTDASGLPLPIPAAPSTVPAQQSQLRASIGARHRAAPDSLRRLYSIVHDTSYKYEEPVERSSHVFRLLPVNDMVQELLESKITVSTDGLMNNFEDVFGNIATRLEVESPYKEMRIVSQSLVRIRGRGPLDAGSPARTFTIPLVWMPWHRHMMNPYLLPPELPETQLRELSDFAMSFVKRQGSDLVETLLDMTRTIHSDFKYVTGSTNLDSTPYDAFVTRKGVCQDFANLLICLARLLNIPARYRVGYIFTGSKYENRQQAEASHAWVELYLPWLGWRGFDPTNGCMADLDHVRVACGRSFPDATPTSGTLHKGGGRETLTVSVRVDLVDENPARA